MQFIKNRKKRWILAILSGMLVATAMSLPAKAWGKGVPAFFGMLYPQYCFSEVPERGKEEIPLEKKLTFRWLRGL